MICEGGGARRAKRKHPVKVNMRENWLVENDEARKALHDLYFETGSLPKQNPNVTPKLPKSPTTNAQSAASQPAAQTKSRASSATPSAEPAGINYLKAAGILGALTVLFVLGYRMMPKFESKSEKPAVTHQKSPMVLQAMRKNEVVSSEPPAISAVQDLGSIAITPTLVMARYEPGRTATQTLAVDNQTLNELTFELEAEDLVASGGRLTLVPAGDSPNSVAATAVFSQKYVRVAPMGKVAVRVSLTWPTTTGVSGVLVRLRSTDSLQLGSDGSITTSLGTLITFAAGHDSKAQRSTTEQSGSASKSHFEISQWPQESEPDMTRPGDAGSASDLKAGRTQNFATPGVTQ